MATETAKFALELEDGISASSESAEDALKSLQSQIDKDARALTQMKKAMRQMQAGGSVDVEAYRKLKAEIDSTQDSIGKARAAFVNLGGDFTKLGKRKPPRVPEVPPPKGLEDMLAATSALPGPLARASKGVGGLRSTVEGMTAAVGIAGAAILGVVAVLTVLVALLAAVAAATAKATAELVKYAAAQADAMRSERLRLEGLGTLRRWMRLTAKDSAQMSESINRVAERTPLARSQIAGYGQELHRLGIRGRAAEDALEALSIAQAVQGDLGRQRLMMLVRMAGHSEGAMANLAERVRKELGGNAAAQMRGLSMISTKLRESFQALFVDVNLEPLLTGLFRLTQLLSQNTESGRALRAIVTAMLTPLIGEIASTARPMEYFLKELVILALRAAIGVLRIRNAIQATFGSGILGRLMSSQRAMEFFRVAAIAVGIVVVALAAGVAFLTAAFIGAITPLMLIAYAYYRGWQATEQLRASLPKLRELLQPSFWVSAGESIIDGIVAGLVAGAARLRTAVLGMARDTLGTFRDALGIRSPSTVFAALGVAIPQGVAQGIDRGAQEATSAAGDMVSTAAQGVASVQGGPSRSITVGEIHIHVGEGEGGEDTARRVTDALRDFFDQGMAAEVPA